MLFLVPSRYLILLGFPTGRHAPGSAPRCACPRNHGRYVIFQMAEVAVPRELFQDILRVIAELRPPPVATPGVRRLTIPCSKANDRRPALNGQSASVTY